MAQEAIQFETNCQLRQNNRKKGQKKEGDLEPGLQTALADKGTRVLTTEVVDGLKKKAEAKFEAKLEAKLSLVNKRKEKAFHNAMIASGSPLGLYEAASAAEHEGKTEITIDVSLRWRVEATQAEYFVTPGSAVGFRLEDHEAGCVHDLLKIERLMGLLPPIRLVAHGDGFLRKRKQTVALFIFHFLKCFVYFISLG